MPIFFLYASSFSQTFSFPTFRSSNSSPRDFLKLWHAQFFNDVFFLQATCLSYVIKTSYAIFPNNITTTIISLSQPIPSFLFHHPVYTLVLPQPPHSSSPRLVILQKHEVFGIYKLFYCQDKSWKLQTLS